MSGSDKTPSTPKRHKHPGSGRGAARSTLKGRQTDPTALSEVRALLGDRPRRADLLIEHLHLIQDRYHHLSARHLAALAEEMKLSMAEVYETATFYAHFDVVMEDEEPPPALTIRVCDSLSCEMAGAAALLTALKGKLSPNIRVVRAPCMGRCDKAPIAEVGHRHVEHASVENVMAAVRAPSHAPNVPAHIGLDEYVKNGGYRLYRACLSGERAVEDIIKLMEGSGLRGLGGAGFPTGRKWRFVRQEPAPRLMAVNADEGEPGTFKDRVYLETDPHRTLEGMLIAAWVVEAADVYFYLRDEYPGVREVLLAEIAKLDQAGLTAKTRIHLRRGAGAYICGEESAMLESIEGRRGEPRHKPPFPSQVGLFGRPTLINNVESLYWVRDIVERGPEWFSGQGRNGRKGLRSFSVSGRVKEPGMKLAPAGITMRQLIDEYCDGMAEGHTFKGYLPGGASGGILPASMADIPLDFDTLNPHGCFIGSAAVIVLSDKDDMRAVALNLMRFFEDESCGQCTPCRVGTEKAVKLMEAGKWDIPLLDELSKAMMDASICGLGQAAPNPLLMVLKHFRSEVA
ncbi:MAG: NADH-quinone oxidoreductase subunit F [Alphaproteobacteria bacterium]|nr:NADH-quinone oxidoreductase subunit F [Alphaproteobacteria bacterium]